MDPHSLLFPVVAIASVVTPVADSRRTCPQARGVRLEIEWGSHRSHALQ